MTPCTLTHLTDHELIAAVARLAQSERATTSDLVAHLAEFDARDLHLAAGYSSLFSYCCEVLHLSEHEAYNRIEAARASRRFPMLLEALAAGRVNLTTVRLLAPHLTSGNHLELLEAAAHLKRRQVEELIASRFPRPDIATSIRRLPKRPVPLAMTTAPTEGLPGTEVVSMPGSIAPSRTAGTAFQWPSKVVPLAPERYALRFTVTAETQTKLREVQDLLRHAIPNGDAGQIFDRALSLLRDDLLRRKAAEVAVPARHARPSASGSRHVPAEVRRAVWRRDAGRCAFVAAGGRRCSATSFLEFHHVKPYAAGGPSTPDNIALRCRAHNAHEARLFFAPLRHVEAPSSA